ncbi:MAG: hypothetical protein JJE21_04955 [Spirochaetaceae bacterium]|nr:hypothetical protein [Spirochaetaceae bacterium]
MSETKTTWKLTTGEDLYKDSKDFFPMGLDPDLTPSDTPSAVITSIEKVNKDKFKLEITAISRASGNDNDARYASIPFIVKFFVAKGDTLTLRFNDYDVDEEDLASYYLGNGLGEDDEYDEIEEIYDAEDGEDAEDQDEIDDDEIDDEDDDDEFITKFEDFNEDEDLEDFDPDEFDEDSLEDEDEDDEIDEDFLFSVGVQRFTITDIDWNTITLEYSKDDEDDFEIKA